MSGFDRCRKAMMQAADRLDEEGIRAALDDFWTVRPSREEEYQSYQMAEELRIHMWDKEVS